MPVSGCQLRDCPMREHGCAIYPTQAHWPRCGKRRSGAHWQDVCRRRTKPIHGEERNSNLAEREQKTFPAITYTGQSIVGEIARTGGRLAGKAISVVHRSGSSSLPPAITGPFTRASLALWY